MEGTEKAALTVGAVALVTGYEEATVKGWLDRGRLPFVQIGRQGWRRVRADDLRQFAARHGLPLAWDRLA